MQVDIFTLFPEWFDWMRRPRHLTNAELELRAFNYRDYTPLAAGQVDDSPYGGGPGMVLRVDVVAAALEAVYGQAADTGPHAAAGDRAEPARADAYRRRRA